MTRAPSRAPALLAALTALALLSTACASTVQVGRGDGRGIELAHDGGPVTEEGDRPTGEDEMFLPSDESSDAPQSTDGPREQTGGAPGAATSGPSSGDRGGPPAPEGEAPQPQGPQGPQADASRDEPGVRPAAAGARGIDARRIVIGLAYAEDSSEANSALGAEGITAGDARRNYEVLLAHFNAQGGAAGRELMPVYYVYSATSAQPFSAQEQAACTTYTQDHEVFVALNSGIVGLTDGTFNACMHNAGTPVLASPGASGTDESAFARWPHLVETNTLTLDAIARVWPGGLAERGYFEPRGPASPTRVGLITFDSEPMRRVTEERLKPAMAAVGQEFHREAYIRPPNRLDDVGGMSAEVQNAMLRFRSAGVEHVMIQDFGNAVMTLLFMNSAESQGYRPRYGLTTNNGGQLLVGVVPPAQYAGARMVGWHPLVDVPSSEFDEPMGRARPECERIYAEAGITHPDTNARLVAYTQCDELMSLIAAVSTGSGPLAQDRLVGDFVGVGTAFTSAVAGPTRFAPDRRFGVARHRLAEFVGECTCFRYTSDWRAMP